MSGRAMLVPGRPRLLLDGAEDTALGRDLIRLETREDDQGVAELEAVFLNFGLGERRSAPGFVHFDRARLDFGRRIAAEVGGETFFDGFIGAIGGSYPEQRPPELTILAEDALARLRLARRSRSFEQRSDAAMLREIAGAQGLRDEVALDGPTHALRWQVGQSELSLLRERAAALDGRIALEDGVLQVRDAPREAPPIALSRLNELIRFDCRADLAEQRSAVAVHGWDVAAKRGVTGEADAAAARAVALAEGRSGAEIIREAWGEAAEALHLEQPATEGEARALAEARMKARARRFVTGRGTTSGTPALRVGRKVELLDLGPWFSGLWEVTEVRHRFDQASGFRTDFAACRAALEPGG